MRVRDLISAVLVVGWMAAPASAGPVERAASGSPAPTVLAAEPFPVPGGQGGIGFDDLGWAPGIGRVLVPAGRSGSLDLIDPQTRHIDSIGGFSAQESFGGGHGEGTTSADEGRGLLFATDRTSTRLLVADPKSRTIVASVPLASGPDYVRYAPTTNEVWVTEPDKDRIEIFSLPASGPPTPAHAAFLAVPGGPESLVMDPARGRAYSNLWERATVAVDIKERKLVATWKNGCAGSRGIALDTGRGFLFAGCAEGKAVALDLNHEGVIADSLSHGSGVDVIAYDPRSAHLYLPGAKSATMAILGVSTGGKLSLLGTVKTASGAHCVAVDDHHQAWVCDPVHGRLLLVHDALAGAGG